MEKRGEEEQVRTIATKRTENEKGIELMAVLNIAQCERR